MAETLRVGDTPRAARAQVILRPARLSDVDALRDFLREEWEINYPLAPAMRPRVWRLMRRAFKAALIRAIRGEKKQQVTVAEAGREVVGYVWSQVVTDYDLLDTLTVRGLCVKKEWRRQGIGKLLANSLQERLRADYKIGKVVAEVNLSNEPVLEFLAEYKAIPWKGTFVIPIGREVSA